MEQIAGNAAVKLWGLLQRGRYYTLIGDIKAAVNACLGLYCSGAK